MNNNGQGGLGGQKVLDIAALTRKAYKKCRATNGDLPKWKNFDNKDQFMAITLAVLESFMEVVKKNFVGKTLDSQNLM